MEQKSSKKGLGVVIALAIAILLGVIVLTVAIVGVLKDGDGNDKNDDTTLYTLSGVQSTTKEDSNNNYFGLDDAQSEESGEKNLTSNNNINVNSVEAGNKATQATTKKNTGYDPIEEYENLSKNGENQLSDHHNNKYIKLVAEKYNVDTELLVAIYSVPDTGNNFVLEFNGKRDEDGNVIKSPDTLSKVYRIDKNKNISVATGKTTGNEGVSYAEGTLCFNMIKTIVMPQYPDYFTGVE
ncbi:MAG: hypothetical protein ACI4VW_03915 [Acutalibacteraceae bacterium]